MSKSKQYTERINIRLRKETYEKLKILAEQDKQSVSEVIRNIVVDNIK